MKAVIAWILAVFLVCCAPASALSTSENALRLEDRREGNALLGAERAVVEKGELYHTIVLVWGKLEVYGQVDEVVVLSGHVTFHPGSKLTQSIVVMGGSFDSKPGAAVAAENVIVKVPGPFWRMLRSAGNVWRENFDWVARFFAATFASLLLWVTGWALFAVFPGLQENTVGRLLREWPKNFLVGLLGSLIVPVLGVMLVLSILGIALLPLYLLLLFCAGVVSYLAAALWAGHRLLPPRPREKIRPLALLLGILALQFLWVAPVWWSSLPVLFLWTLGWGALLRGMRTLWR